MSRFLIMLIRIYQYGLSPLVGTHCRYTPSCSQYAIEAFRKYDLGRAVRLSVTRILRCNPWCAGGCDPLP